MLGNRILVVDDEQDLVWAVRRSLKDEGYEVITAYDGIEALTVASRYHPDLVILDIRMPGLDGFEVCRKLRRNPNMAAVPILFLTVCNGTKDLIKGLDEGGDDYLLKPFNLQELNARIRALLRRGHPTNGRGLMPEDEHVLKVGSLALDLHTHQVFVRGNSVQLTPMELKLLHYLMIHPSELLSNRQLLEEVWGYPFGTADSSLVRWHIKNLRAKIEHDSSRPVYICTVPHHGYILRDNVSLASRPSLG
jgi:DNA-binding response OmpR family regulator